MSIAELLVIFIVAVIFFGPAQLPTLAKKLADLIKLFRKNQTKWQTVVDQLNKEETLDENIKKALKADKHYQQSKPE